MRKPKENNKIVLGLTGGFGTGKTTVARIFRRLGADIIDADKISHGLLTPQSKVYSRLVKTFGREILTKKTIDRNALGRIVFRDKASLEKLERIIHPQVIKIIKQEIVSSRYRLVVLEAPLLFEKRLAGLVNKTIVVTSDFKGQICRLKKKTGLSGQEISRRIKSQMPLKEKVRLADFVIDNSGTMDKTRKQVIAIRRLIYKRLDLKT